MATVKQLRNWMVRDLTRPNFQVNNSEQSSDAKRFRATIYTETTEYHLLGIEYPVRGQRANYLGCIASSRRSRPGEDWRRGNDLADGDLTEHTWQHILTDIVRYEAQRISAESNDNERIKNNG